MYIAAALATLVPPAAAVLVWLKWKPRAAANAWASGLGGFVAGAALMGFAFLLKQAVLILGLAKTLALTDTPAPGEMARTAILAGLLAGIAEELVRFGAGAALFRRTSGAKPLLAGALFALGWGGIESALLMLRALPGAAAMAADPTAHLPGWLPLFALIERVGAWLLHLALTAAAVRAASDLRVGAGRRALALFAGAVVLHAAIDATVHGLYLFATPAIDAMEWGTVAARLVPLEGGFVIVTALLFVAALRLPPTRV